MSKYYLSKLKKLNKIKIDDGKIWLKELDRVALKDPCVKKNKKSIKVFLDKIQGYIMDINYSDEEFECIIRWICDQYLYWQKLNKDEINLLNEYVKKYNTFKLYEKNEELLNNIIINSPPTRCNMLLFRGSFNQYFFNKQVYNNEIYTIDRPTSFTFDIKISELFISSNYGLEKVKQECCYLFVNLPPGSNSLIIFPQFISGFKSVLGKNEILLSTNTKLRFVEEKIIYKNLYKDRYPLNYQIFIFNGVLNIEYILKMIKDFKKNPSKEKFNLLPHFVQKIFILYSKYAQKNKIGNNLVNEILQYKNTS